MAPPPSLPLLHMRGIRKSFSGVEVLTDVGFELRAGEVHALAGENGAGKSTLMKILAGVYGDYSGGIELSGTEVRFRSPREATAAGIAIIHQEMSLIGSMTVAENIVLGREKGGIWLDRRGHRARAESLCREVGLDADVNRPVEEFPVSIQQLIEIAKALSVSARIIVMDEPTSSLSDPEVERLFAIIGMLKKRRTGIIYITHKMDELYRIADRMTILRDGRNAGTFPAAELSRGELVRLMVGREINQQFPARSAARGTARLTVEHLNVLDPRRKGRLFLDDLSFEVAGGEILGIAGLQGSGNSQLLNALFGAYGRPSSGTVSIDGRRCSLVSPGYALREGFALLTDDRKRTGLVMEMGVFQNITLAALRSYSPRGWLESGKEREAARRHVAALRLKTNSLDQEVSTLSGGNQQKVVLAKWLETEPKVFLLDEPTRGVDIAVKHEIYELMNRWTAGGCAVLLVSSDMTELLAMSDRIIVLCRGKETARFSRAEATQEKVLHAAMGAEGAAA